MSQIPITALYAGGLGLLSVLLANYVLYARINARTLPKWSPDAALRVQANFVENAPLALILLYLIEVSGASASTMHAFGTALVIVRLLHAWGLARHEGANYPRLIGAQGTFLLMSIMSVTLVYSYLIQ